MADIPNAKNVAYSYTLGSVFTKYLLWPSDKCDGDPAKIPPEGYGAGILEVNPSGQIDHRMHCCAYSYKFLNRVPRSRGRVFIRSVTDQAYLPHNLGKPTSQPQEPTVGKGYLKRDLHVDKRSQSRRLRQNSTELIS